MNETALALLIARAAVGVVFVAHGSKHFKNREKTIRWNGSLGFKAPRLQWFFMTFAEIGIGLGLLLGLLTAFSAAGLVAMMFVAFWTVHRHAGFWITARPDEGWEYVFVLVAAAISLAILGPGEWSLDHLFDLADSFDGLTGLGIALGGLCAAVLQLVAFYRPESR